MKLKKTKFIIIFSFFAILPIVIVPPIAVSVINKIRWNSNDLNNHNSLVPNVKKLDFNLGINMQNNLRQYFSISHYSSEYLNSLDNEGIIKIFLPYFDNINEKNWVEIFETFETKNPIKTIDNYIIKNSLDIHVKTKNNYVFSNLEKNVMFTLEWTYNENFNLNIKKETVVNQIKLISEKNNYFDDEFNDKNSLQFNYEKYKEVISKINDFSNFNKFQEAIKTFEIKSNNNGNPWLNSINFKLEFKENYKFLESDNIISEKIEWGYTPIASKVVFRHTGEMIHGEEQTIQAQVGGLTTNARITYKWYKNGELLENETSSKLIFNGVFKENVFKAFNGNDFNSLVNQLTDTYTVDILYNGKEFINHNADSTKITPLKLIIKPKEQLLFDSNNIQFIDHSVWTSNATYDLINKDNQIIQNWQKGSFYNLNFLYNFDSFYTFKLFKEKFLNFEVIIFSEKERKSINLLDKYITFNEQSKNILVHLSVQTETIFQMGKYSISIKVSLKDNVDLDNIVNFDLKSGSRDLSNITFS